jgi:putative ATP-dependent endonuclease of OLD family
MIIKRVEIKNYRSLKAIDLDCNSVASHEGRALVALLGRNGVGKSSILYALNIFYDVNAKVTTDDFYNRDPLNEIMIRVTYGNLNNAEKEEFKSFIVNDELIVTKHVTSNDGRIVQKYFGAARQIPEFAECRTLSSKNEQRSRYAELAALDRFADLPGNVRSADVVLENMAKFEAKHPEMLEVVEREQQFFGPKEIGGGKLDKFTKFVLVPAVREAAAEAGKKGVIYELIDMIVLRKINARQDVRDLRAEMERRIVDVFSPNNLTELAELGASVTEVLEQFAPGSALKLEWGEPKAPELPLPPAAANLVEDDFPSPISHSGHGLQRALILALLQHLAVTPRPAAQEEEPVEKEGKEVQLASDEIFNPDLILAIEEPELFLHPSRCRYLSDLFLHLSTLPADQGSARNQIIYATHSAYFVDLHRFDELRIARKPKNNDHPAPCCVISQYSLDSARQELARIASREPQEFTRESFRARALPVMTLAVNEGFFADTVVVVEGLSDVGLLWQVQKQLEMNWAALGIVVVPALGKENLDRPIVVFRGLQIPTYLIFDGDSRHNSEGNKVRRGTIERNARYQRIAGVEPVEFPETQVHDTWAVFANDMETNAKESIGEEFDEIAQKACAQLGYDKPSLLMKNTEGAAMIVELAYGVGLRLKTVEEIVARITALRHASSSPHGVQPDST